MRKLLCFAACFSITLSLYADDLAPVKNWKGDVLTIGRDEAGQALRVMLSPKAFDYVPNRLRILTLIDIGADAAQHAAVRQRLEALFESDDQQPIQQAWLYITPDSVPGDADRVRLLSFPPQGPAYHTPNERTASAVWRFVAWYAPDLIVEVHSNQIPEYQAFKQGQPAKWEAGSLALAASNDVMGWGSVPTVRLSVEEFLLPEPPRPSDWNRTDALLQAVTQGTPSPLHKQVQERRERNASEVVDQLLTVYGHELKTVMYQPALAVVARHQRAVDRGNAAEVQAVEDILQPYLSGQKPALPERPNGSQIAGHLAFSEWAGKTKSPAAIKLVQTAADFAFDSQGQPLEAMPTHSEMSDAVFMGCPILTSAARFTGDPKYLDMAGRHLRFMRKLCVREDGLYRHSPLCEAPWGRGNGFPTLGLTLCLTDLDAILDDASLADIHPVARSLREEMLRDFREHCKSLLTHQDVTGMWRQVIDDERAYREMTATCMIGFAMQRGLDRGWLAGPQYQSAVDSAWQAVKVRIGSRGELLDVCTGTGKQQSLEDYFDRTAVSGVDERGGAMALLFARERERSEVIANK